MNALDNLIRGVGIVSTLFLCVLVVGLAVLVFVILLPLLLPLLMLLALMMLVVLIIGTIYLIGKYSQPRE